MLFRMIMIMMILTAIMMMIVMTRLEVRKATNSKILCKEFSVNHAGHTSLVICRDDSAEHKWGLCVRFECTK